MCRCSCSDLRYWGLGASSGGECVYEINAGGWAERRRPLADRTGLGATPARACCVLYRCADQWWCQDNDPAPRRTARYTPPLSLRHISFLFSYSLLFVKLIAVVVFELACSCFESLMNLIIGLTYLSLVFKQFNFSGMLLYICIYGFAFEFA